MKNLVILSGIMIAMSLLVGQVYATGCPTNFVAEHIEEAIKAIENQQYDAALNELELANEAIGSINEESE